LRAISVPDAAAFVEIDGKLRLLQPPFTKGFSPGLNRADLEDAIRRGSHHPIERSFPTLGDAIQFLRDEQRTWARRIGLPLEERVSASEFLSDATPELARNILDKIEHELLQVEACGNAETLLTAIIQAFDGHDELQLRAAKLLSKLNSAHRGRARSARAKDERFDTLQTEEERKRINEISERIRGRHSVLELV
jgi:hypothetical protein